MKSALFFCGIPVVVTAFLVVSVEAENIHDKKKLFQRSSQEVALVGHVIQSTQASSDMDCLVDCSREQRCLSFNYKSDKDDGNLVCELNDQTRQSRPDSVVQMTGYYNYGPESSCTSDLCFNGGTCHSVPDDPHQRYSCQCHPDFTGDHCQESMADFDINFPRRSSLDYVMLRKMPHQLTSFTVSLFVNVTKDVDHTFVSYATTSGKHNAVFVHQRSSVLTLWINNNKREFTSNKINADGAWHHLAMTWENVQGVAALYLDGIHKVSLLNLATGQTVEANGIIAIGNDQDRLGGGFTTRDAMCGSISSVNIWNTVLAQDDIIALAGKCGNEAGATVAWKDFRTGTAGVSYHGEAQYMEPSGLCKYP